MAEKQARGKGRHRGAAALGRHLGGVGLQGVVHHVKTQAQHRAGWHGPPPSRGKGQHSQRGGHEDRPCAHQHHLAQATDQQSCAQRIAHAAQREQHHQRAHGRQRQVEALVKVCGDEGKRPVQAGALEEHRDEHHPRPGPDQHRAELTQRSLQQVAGRGRARRNDRRRQTAPHPLQQHGRQCEEDGHAVERGAPVQVLGRVAAGPDADRKAGDLADQKARQHRLPPLVGHHVADPGHGQWNHRRRTRAGQQARGHQRVMAVRQRAQQRRQRRRRARPADHAVLAKTVAQRAKQQLGQTVGDGEHGDHLRGLAERNLEFARQSRQQRIGQAHRHAAGQRGQRQRGDCQHRDRWVRVEGKGFLGHPALCWPSPWAVGWRHESLGQPWCAKLKAKPWRWAGSAERRLGTSAQALF